MIKLVPIDAVKASEYNPRRNDEKRLALAELSLRKLGFLLPIYADEHGEILSGHQRQLVARRMGFPEIPVEYVSEKELGERKAVNVLFNRATNDLQKQDTCAIVKKRLYEMDIQAMTEALPDIEPGSPESLRLCAAPDGHREARKGEPPQFRRPHKAARKIPGAEDQSLHADRDR